MNTTIYFVEFLICAVMGGWCVYWMRKNHKDKK